MLPELKQTFVLVVVEQSSTEARNAYPVGHTSGGGGGEDVLGAGGGGGESQTRNALSGAA